MAENLPVTNDLVFQSIFGKVGNERITKGFLEKVLGIEIEDLTLDANKRLIGEEVDDKRSRLDVKAVLKDGTKVFIEMQVEPYDYMPKRMVFYCSKIYTEGLKRSRSYDEIKKTIGILIMKKNLKITKQINKYHTVWSLREKDNPEIELTDEFVIHIIELDKFNEEARGEEEYDWIKFIKEAKEELERLASDPELSERYEGRIEFLRDQISAMEETNRKAWDRGMKSGMKHGIKERQKETEEKSGREERKRRTEEKNGIEQGIESKQKEVVLNMHKKQMNIKDICEIVNLSKEEVEKIINNEK